ncbi:unnamed protein product [Urochloa humidicola]
MRRPPPSRDGAHVVAAGTMRPPEGATSSILGTPNHAGTSTGAHASTCRHPPRPLLPRRRREMFLQWQSRPPSTAPPSPSSSTFRANPWWSPLEERPRLPRDERLGM